MGKLIGGGGGVGGGRALVTPVLRGRGQQTSSTCWPVSISESASLEVPVSERHYLKNSSKIPQKTTTPNPKVDGCLLRMTPDFDPFAFTCRQITRVCTDSNTPTYLHTR